MKRIFISKYEDIPKWMKCDYGVMKEVKKEDLFLFLCKSGYKKYTDTNGEILEKLRKNIKYIKVTEYTLESAINILKKYSTGHTCVYVLSQDLYADGMDSRFPCFAAGKTLSVHVKRTKLYKEGKQVKLTGYEQRREKIQDIQADRNQSGQKEPQENSYEDLDMFSQLCPGYDSNEEVIREENTSEEYEGMSEKMLKNMGLDMSGNIPDDVNENMLDDVDIPEAVFYHEPVDITDKKIDNISEESPKGKINQCTSHAAPDHTMNQSKQHEEASEMPDDIGTLFQNLSGDRKKKKKEQPDDSVDLKAIEKEIFGLDTDKKKITEKYTDLENAKAHLVDLYLERLVSHMIRYLPALKNYLSDRNIVTEIVLLLCKAKSLEDFSKSMEVLGFSFPVNEKVYYVLQDEAKFYSKVCSFLYGEDFWD